MNVSKEYLDDLVKKCDFFIKRKRMCPWTRRSVLEDALWRLNVFPAEDVIKYFEARAKAAKATDRLLRKGSQLKLTPIWREEHRLSNLIALHIKKWYYRYANTPEISNE